MTIFLETHIRTYYVFSYLPLRKVGTIINPEFQMILFDIKTRKPIEEIVPISNVSEIKTAYFFKL